MQQHQFKQQTTAVTAAPQLAQVRLEADMLRGAVMAAAIQGTVNAVRGLFVRRERAVA